MALTTGAIPLPLAKFDKFNNKTFSGRRWQGVDPQKDMTASALAVANKFSSRTRECAARGLDFEEVLFELAEEEMLITSFGLKTETTVESPSTPATAEEDEKDEKDEKDSDEPKDKKPKRKKAAANRL
jgi:capsid protein